MNFIAAGFYYFTMLIFLDTKAFYKGTIKTLARLSGVLEMPPQTLACAIQGSV